MAEPLPPSADPTASHLEMAVTLAAVDPGVALVHATVAAVHEQRRAADALDRIARRLSSPSGVAVEVKR